MEQWTTTTDTRIAAAFGTLGMVIRPKKVLDERSGVRVVRYHIGLESVDRAYQTKPIQHAATFGTLAQDHPFLTILRACENRRRLLDLANRGTFCALRPVAGAPGTFQYVPADGGLPGLPATGVIFCCTNISTPSSTACEMPMVPAASGRWRLRRCTRSAGRSSRSLTR
jgi:hypothetical protein